MPKENIDTFDDFISKFSDLDTDVFFKAINGENLIPEEYQPSNEYRRILIYDFKRPNRFSKEHIQKLSIIHEITAEKWAPIISQTVHENADIKYSSIDSIAYYEFIRCIPNPTLRKVQ